MKTSCLSGLFAAISSLAFGLWLFAKDPAIAGLSEQEKATARDEAVFGANVLVVERGSAGNTIGGAGPSLLSMADVDSIAAKCPSVVAVAPASASLSHGAEDETRRWLSKAASAAIWDYHVPSADFRSWLDEGKRLSDPEPVLRGMLERREKTADIALVAYALGFLGNRNSVPPLVNALGSGDWAQRAFSAVALGELRDARAAEPLGKLLLGDPNATVRANAVVALGKIRGPAALRFLQKAQGDDDPFVARIAKELLSADAPNPTPASARVSTTDSCHCECVVLSHGRRLWRPRLRRFR